MPILAALAIVLLSGSLLLVGLLGCSRSTGAEDKVDRPAVEQPVTADGVSGMSAEALREMLADLETASPPEPKMGAMCYEPMPMPLQHQYICSKCGEKTIYAHTDKEDPEAVWRLSFLADCRRIAKSIPKSDDVTIALDESEYCSHCTPDAEMPELALIVKYKDGRTHRARPIKAIDLRMLRDFLGGKKAYETFNEGTMPLKDSLPRLRELLGLADEEGTEEHTSDETTE